MAEASYHQKGFGLKAAVQDHLTADYHSRLIEEISRQGFVHRSGRLTFRLAQAFGFCYGVDRTVQYAYETRQRFPDRSIYITSEIIHNPHVNERLIDMGMHFLSGRYRGTRGWDDVTAEDVVIIPAFGATVAEMERLKDKKCTLVDTTCGSVLNVWKNVERYAKRGVTSIIHGKHFHEETQATMSRVTAYPGAHFLVVLDLEEAEVVCRYIREGGDPSTGSGLSREAFLEKFAPAVSPGFDPDLHLRRAGLANQTTMLRQESMAIAGKIREALVARWGEGEIADRFVNFDTICSATQERQDAVLSLLETPPDLMIVIGGYNSSNTTHLVEIPLAQGVAAFHIDDAKRIVDLNRIRHKPPDRKEEIETEGWLPEGDLVVGLTAGASTPNSKIGEVIERLEALLGAGAEKPVGVH